MAECVRADFVMSFVKTAFRDSDLDSAVDGGGCHVMATSMHRLALADPGSFPSAAHSRKEPMWIFMPFPKCAKTKKKLRSNGDLPAFSPLAIGDADDESLPINILGANRRRLR